MKNVGCDITQGLKQLVGGELTSYTEMMDKARDIALERMIRAAESMGADAVVSMRYTTSAIVQGAAEVLAYGTAVKWMDAWDREGFTERKSIAVNEQRERSTRRKTSAAGNMVPLLIWGYTVGGM